MKNKIPGSKKCMQFTVLFLILSVLLFSCKNKPEYPTEDEARAAIMEKINMANDSWASGDPMGFLDCAAVDVIWIDDLRAQKPVVGYEALGKYLETFKGLIPPHKHELLDVGFQFYGDIVILNYRYQGIFDGEPANPWKVTSVYRYQDGDWLSVHENWTVVKE